MQRNDELEHGLWWVQRWVSGSMDDPDWEWSEAEATGAERGFEAVRKAIGGVGSAGGEVWRYLCVSEAEALRMEGEMTLLPHEHPFQSFTTGRLLAARAGADLCREGEVDVLVRARPPAEDVMFGMADLLTARWAATWMGGIDHWHHQDEVVVRVAGPLPILEVHRVDLDAELADDASGPRF